MTIEKCRTTCSGRGFFINAGLGACLLGGCVGEGSIAYHGTVTAASVSGHSFDAKSNPSNGTPIQGARVLFRITSSQREHCGNVSGGGVIVTDAQGSFDGTSTFGGFPFVDQAVLVCVEHSDYEGYEYRTIYGKSKDPQQGEKYLNVTLRKK
jgi:hypothetical protein